MRIKKLFADMGLFVLITTLLVGAVFAIYGGPVEQPFDSGVCVALSDCFVNNGKFAFSAYPQHYRGYLLPFLIYISKTVLPLQNINLVILLMNTIVMAAFLVWGIRPFVGKYENWKKFAAGGPRFYCF